LINNDEQVCEKNFNFNFNYSTQLPPPPTNTSCQIGPPICIVCKNIIFPSDSNPLISFEKELYHSNCINCTLCSTPLQKGNIKRSDRGLSCSQCPMKE